MKKHRRHRQPVAPKAAGAEPRRWLLALVQLLLSSAASAEGDEVEGRRRGPIFCKAPGPSSEKRETTAAKTLVVGVRGSEFETTFSHFGLWQSPFAAPVSVFSP